MVLGVYCLLEVEYTIITANLKGGKTAVKGGKIPPFPPTRLDGVPGTQTSRLLLSYNYYTTAIEATALFVQQVKGAIIADLYHMTPPHGEKWLLYQMIVRELRQ